MASFFSLRRDKMSCIKFQIVPDLHLELGHYYTPPKIPVEAPYLILVGDIGQLNEVFDSKHYLLFLKTQCENFQHVYFVLGNHEFYGVTRQAGIELATRLEAEPTLQFKLTVLYRKRIDVSDEVTLLGCTLNTQISREAHDIVQAKVADFRKIQDWTIQQHNREHTLDLEWLRGEATSIQANEPKRRILIATHHAPSLKSTMSPLLENEPSRSAFATAILESESNTWTRAPCLRYWVFGHTHWNSEIRVGKLILCSNQKGYERNKGSEGEQRITNANKKTVRFDVRKTIEV